MLSGSAKIVGSQPALRIDTRQHDSVGCLRGAVVNSAAHLPLSICLSVTVTLFIESCLSVQPHSLPTKYSTIEVTPVDLRTLASLSPYPLGSDSTAYGQTVHVSFLTLPLWYKSTMLLQPTCVWL
jgi:hypothetical protein